MIDFTQERILHRFKDVSPTTTIWVS